jgi:hypothetical protein
MVHIFLSFKVDQLVIRTSLDQKELWTVEIFDFFSGSEVTSFFSFIFNSVLQHKNDLYWNFKV